MANTLLRPKLTCATTVKPDRMPCEEDIRSPVSDQPKKK